MMTNTVLLSAMIDTSTWGGKLGVAFLLLMLGIAVLAMLGRSGDGKKMNQTGGGGGKKSSKSSSSDDDE